MAFVFNCRLTAAGVGMTFHCNTTIVAASTLQTAIASVSFGYVLTVVTSYCLLYRALRLLHHRGNEEARVKVLRHMYAWLEVGVHRSPLWVWAHARGPLPRRCPMGHRRARPGHGIMSVGPTVHSRWTPPPPGPDRALGFFARQCCQGFSGTTKELNNIISSFACRYTVSHRECGHFVPMFMKILKNSR